MKKIISTVLALLMVMSMIPMLALSISATEPDVTISDSDELLVFANNIKDGTDNYEGKIVEITADIAIPSGTQWPDMSDKSFAGTLDGNGHTISGLRLAYTEEDTRIQKIGFFGNVTTGATIKDICITDSSITGIDDFVVGGIFGRVDGSCTIDNVYTDIDITVTRTVEDSDHDTYEIGGFIGKVGNCAVNIKNSVAVGDVITNGAIAKVGGLIGFVDPGSTGSAKVSITDSAVYGNVTANGNSTGLIVGRIYRATEVELTNVIAAGTMTITNSTQSHYGAFVGRIQSGTFNIASSVYTATKAVGNGSATNDSNYDSTTPEALKTTVPTGFNTWIIDANLNNGYPLPINVAYMLNHVNKDTATDRYETAFAGYQNTDFVDGFSNIRLIGVVNDTNDNDSLDDEYTAVGFEVEMISPKTWNNKTDNGAAPKITTVYSSVLEGKTPKSASDLGGDYIFVATITGVKQNVGDVTFVVKTFHDTDDGRVYDDAYVITYNTGAIAS